MQVSSISGHGRPGRVITVRGSVVDAVFDEETPPHINNVLRAGEQGRVVIEVLAQSGGGRVRGVALTPTEGLGRGSKIEDTGAPLTAPVGPAILSRVFDVFGRTIDRGDPVTGVEWQPIHQPPPPLEQRSTESQIFETGIKVIDLLAPMERGGKAGLFGGAGVGKTVLLTEIIHNMAGRTRLSENGVHGERKGQEASF